MLSQLCQERSGLTVMRFEPGRHGVLCRCRKAAAVLLGLAVLSQETLVAVLAVG